MAIYVCLLVLLILLVFNTKSKNILIDICAFILLFLICYLSKDIPDMKNYGDFYDNIGNGYLNSFLGSGWMALCILANKIGLSYVLFKSILYTISCILIYLVIGKFSKTKKSHIFLLYLIFPGLLDLVQIRFFFASSIVLFTLTYLFIFPTKINKYVKMIIYVSVTLLVSLIHISCLFYLLFAFIPLLRILKVKSLFKTTIFLSILMLFAIKFMDKILLSILPEAQASRILAYFNGDYISLPALIVYSSLFVIQFILTYLIYKKCKLYKKDRNIVKNICIINTLLILSIPFVYITSDFLRIQRPFLLLNYSLFIVSIKKVKFPKLRVFDVNIKYKELFTFSVIVYVVLFIILFNYESLFSFFNLI